MIHLLKQTANKVESVYAAYADAMEVSSDTLPGLSDFLQPALALNATNAMSPEVSAYMSLESVIPYSVLNCHHSDALSIGFKAFDSEKTYEVTLCKSCLQREINTTRSISLFNDYTMQTIKADKIDPPKGCQLFTSEKVYTTPLIELWPEWLHEIDINEDIQLDLITELEKKCNLPKSCIGGHSLIPRKLLCEDIAIHILVEHSNVLAQFDVTDYLPQRLARAVNLVILEQNEDNHRKHHVIVSLTEDESDSYLTALI